MKWIQWKGGLSGWPFGALKPTEVLYELAGPAIFVTTIGLEQYLFYKSGEYDNGDYYIAVSISSEELDALKAGRLSLRGALQQAKAWLFDIDLDMQVQRFEQVDGAQISPSLPRSGLALYANYKSAPDSFAQASSPLAFKFFGQELKDGLMPLDIFRNLVTNVYDVVRRSFVPPALSPGRGFDLIEFPLRQPLLASLLIPIDYPSIDVARLRRRHNTKDLDPDTLLQEANAEGVRFVEQFERTIDIAESGKVTQSFARDNITLLDNINDIMPGERSDISKLQLSSTLGGKGSFIEVDREIGERLRHAYRDALDRNIDVSGVIIGMMRKSRSLVLRGRYGRELTCYLVPSIYDDLLTRGELTIGRRLTVSGRFQKRDKRDLMKVDGAPRLL